MVFELTITKNKEEQILNYLKKFDFVTVRKKRTQKKATKSKLKKESSFTYFDTCPQWNIEAKELRQIKARKNKIEW